MDDLTLMLEAVAAIEPTETVPDLRGLGIDERLAVLGHLYRRGWITAHVFLGEQVAVGQMLSLTEAGKQELEARWDAQDADAGDELGDSIDEKRLRRSDFLKSLYEITQGNLSATSPSLDVGQRLGWDETETLPVTRSLRQSGHIVYRGVGPKVSLTAKGIEAVEGMATTGPTSGAPVGSLSDRDLMKLAIAQARQCVSEVGKVSPKVGAVATRDGVLLGEAHRGEFAAGDHAEYTLLERKLQNETLAGATLFTTLEPCTSRNAPKLPCVERIIERRVHRVVIGVLDPNDAIRGRGQLRLRDAGIEVSVFDADLMAEIEELNREFSREHSGAGQVERTDEQLADPAEDEVGPNGHRVGYNEVGDKVEWIPDEDNPDETVPLLLRRNDKQVLATYNELWDKVWWTRHQAWKSRIESGEEMLGDARREMYERATEAASKIEAKYPRHELELDEFDWGLLNGRMSAFAWIFGAEWNESLDT